MGDSQTPASRSGLQVHAAGLTVCCHPAANSASAWSPGRANAWTVQGINYFFISQIVLAHDVMGQRQEFTELCGCCMALLRLWGEEY